MTENVNMLEKNVKILQLPRFKLGWEKGGIEGNFVIGIPSHKRNSGICGFASGYIFCIYASGFQCRTRIRITWKLKTMGCPDPTPRPITLQSQIVLKVHVHLRIIDLCGS